jgi:hypothetical protein
MKCRCTDVRDRLKAEYLRGYNGESSDENQKILRINTLLSPLYAPFLFDTNFIHEG